LKSDRVIVLIRKALVALAISWIAIAVAFIWLFVVNLDLKDQQTKTALLTSELCRSEKLQRGVLVGLALNQPSLDMRLVTILQKTLNQLPQRCP
jgi:hypothetical protein